MTSPRGLASHWVSGRCEMTPLRLPRCTLGLPIERRQTEAGTESHRRGGPRCVSFSCPPQCLPGKQRAPSSDPVGSPAQCYPGHSAPEPVCRLISRLSRLAAPAIG
ncbi:Hypothetical predicted protein [Pelobates cultripes]|uniref:Uncharacterized protein n=1 Tax=Pelobates cultripes TaxID=61616 RepID=A0AAD1SNY3_PELCU|nr:Hypothetical predicted protein [Pelobates cultripes]